MITTRCYAAATLELSQLDNEERKAKALAAATTELERLFRKMDFGRMKVVVGSIRCLYIFTDSLVSLSILKVNKKGKLPVQFA